MLERGGGGGGGGGCVVTTDNQQRHQHIWKYPKCSSKHTKKYICVLAVSATRSLSVSSRGSEFKKPCIASSGGGRGGGGGGGGATAPDKGGAC